MGQLSSFLLMAVWPGCEGHTVRHMRKNHNQVGGGGQGQMQGVLLWPFQNSCFKDRRSSGDEVLTEVPGRRIIFEIWLRRQHCVQCLCLFSRRTPISLWSSLWPSVLKAWTFELKSKTCKLLENSLVDDQHLIWSGRLSPSSSSSRWCFELRFKSKLFLQADTCALHLGIKGPVGLHCAQPPSTFICSPERGMQGCAHLPIPAPAISPWIQSSTGQDQVVEIRNWD